jgi:hypothetical protein
VFLKNKLRRYIPTAAPNSVPDESANSLCDKSSSLRIRFSYWRTSIHIIKTLLPVISLLLISFTYFKARCPHYVFWNPKIPKKLYPSYRHKTVSTISPIQFPTKTGKTKIMSWICGIMCARKTAINPTVVRSSYCAIVPEIIIYIETVTDIIDPNNIKLKCINIISPVLLYTQHRHVL